MNSKLVTCGSYKHHQQSMQRTAVKALKAALPADSSVGRFALPAYAHMQCQAGPCLHSQAPEHQTNKQDSSRQSLACVGKGLHHGTLLICQALRHLEAEICTRPGSIVQVHDGLSTRSAAGIECAVEKPPRFNNNSAQMTRQYNVGAMYIQPSSAKQSQTTRLCTAAHQKGS